MKEHSVFFVVCIRRGIHFQKWRRKSSPVGTFKKVIIENVVKVLTFNPSSWNSGIGAKNFVSRNQTKISRPKRRSWKSGFPISHIDHFHFSCAILLFEKVKEDFRSLDHHAVLLKCFAKSLEILFSFPGDFLQSFTQF
ncbi:hypothetical protein D3C87_1402730 [compost metagenome]